MSKKEVATSDSPKTKRCWTLAPNWFWLFDTPAPWGGEDLLRSFFYNLFLAPALWAHTLWLVVVLQSLIVAHLLRLVLRVVFGLTSPFALLGVTVPLCLLSNLPWFTGFIMPDIFTGVLILALFLLVFCLPALGAGEKNYLFGPVGGRWSGGSVSPRTWCGKKLRHLRLC